MAVVTLNFQGYAQCRLATDPDPTNERRGVSGYTFAMAGEPDMDFTIYTQNGPKVVNRVGVDRQVGVQVVSGFCGTKPIQKGHPLFGASIDLEDSPRFEERNYVVTQQTFGVISPFKLRVKGKGIGLFRQVDFYPGKPLNFPVWETPQEVLQPYTAQGFTSGDPNCIALLSSAGGNPSVYRANRLATLRKLYKPSLPAIEKAALDKRISELMMDDPRDRRTSQLINSAPFSYALNGPAAVQVGTKKAQWLNGAMDDKGGWHYLDPAAPLSPWPCSFWMGSWDADSLTFYMQGTLKAYDLGADFDKWLATV
jgi:hypothetical protein